MKKQQNRLMLVFALPAILALVSLGCGLSGILDNDDAAAIPTIPTRTPMPTFTPTPEGDAFIPVTVVGNPPEAAASQEQPDSEVPEVPPTEIVEPSPTPLPTDIPEPTATPTPEGVSVTLIQNMNVRGGPGTNYPIIGPGPVGESAKVLGRNNDGSWLQIEYPSADGLGWIYGPLVQINGDSQAVAVASAPPPPEPTPTPAPTAPPPPPEPQYQFTPTGWHASGNPGIVHFKGRIRDEAGNLVNGYSVLVDNWAWSVISCPSGPGIPAGCRNKGPGEWDVIIPSTNIGDGVGWWWLSVVRYDCQDFPAAFDSQCKQFTRLSEEVKIMVNWPDETVVNADWVCHWDCDKGLESLKQ